MSYKNQKINPIVAKVRPRCIYIFFRHFKRGVWALLRIGTGELDNGLELPIERIEFLYAADRVTGNSVRKKLFSKCQALVFAENIPLLDIATAVVNNSSFPQLNSGWNTLIERIHEWQQEVHLEDEWVVAIALHTLHDGENWRHPGVWRPKHFRHQGVIDFKYEFDLAVQAEGDIVERLTKEFKEKMRAIIKQASDEDIAKGATRTLKKRNRSGDERLHYEWLARHVVLDESYPYIARHSQIKERNKVVQIHANVEVTPDTVQEAVESVAKRIGLRLL